MKKRKTMLRMLFWVALVVVFTTLTTLFVFAAAGFRVNWQTKSISKTGLIVLKGEENNVEIKLNGKFMGNKLPLRLPYLLPGWYEVTISRDTYITWQKSIWVSMGQAYEEKDVVLWRSDMKAEVESDENRVSLLNNTKTPDNIIIDGGEVAADGKLVTRFMETPGFYAWYSDHSHIVIQIGNQIRVIELDGGNDTVLAELESSEPSVFRIIEGGKILLYKDGLVVKRVLIR